MSCSREQALKNLAKAKSKGGRPKGSINRYTRLRNQILDAIENLGGQKWIEEECAKGDPSGFIRVAASLLPKTRNINHAGSIIIQADEVEKK